MVAELEALRCARTGQVETCCSHVLGRRACMRERGLLCHVTETLPCGPALSVMVVSLRAHQLTVPDRGIVLCDLLLLVAL